VGSPGQRRVDGEAGPVIRPYALVGGRTQPAGGSFDLIAMVTVQRRATPDPGKLEPEHRVVLRLCRVPMSVADLAAELHLPVGVVRVILADLREQGIITIHRPVSPANLIDAQILERVADGLRRL
jgi:Protein of unknown function (DUF742)